MSYATMYGQELLPRKSFHKSSKIKSGVLQTVKVTLKLNFISENVSIHAGCQDMETIEWIGATIALTREDR